MSIKTLPIYNTEDKPMMLMQTKWAAALNTLLTLPLLQGNLLKNVALVSGDNTINHKLDRKLVGWFPVRLQDNYAQLYDLQNENQMTDKTLVLHASTSITIDLYVF